jgi:hypothetical protein
VLCGARDRDHWSRLYKGIHALMAGRSWLDRFGFYMLAPYDSQSRIIEGVMTSLPVAADGGVPLTQLERVNVAPMGPIVDADWRRFILRPFRSSTTYQNLKATGEGVFHVVDDVLLIARGAIGKVEAGGEGAPVRPANVVHGVVLTGACRHYELRVIDLDDHTDRTTIVAECVHVGRHRDFIGFNRAMHAVLEAAILATRLHLTGASQVLAELDRLQVMVDKTGSEAEHQAMGEVRAYVEQYDATLQKQAARS